MIMINTPDFLSMRSGAITQKYYILTRNIDESGAKDLTPNEEEVRNINAILDLPDFTSLNVEQKALMWHFRYSLTSNKRALVKFLQCVNWNNEKEEQETMALLKKWVEIDIDQALPLLSFLFCANSIYHKGALLFNNQFQRYNEIRTVGVRCLDKQTPQQINSIMLQLVQAYRYESFNNSPLKKFLLGRAARDETIAYTLHWHVNLE